MIHRVIHAVRRVLLTPLLIVVAFVVRQGWVRTIATPDGRRFQIPPTMDPGDVVNLFLGGHEREEIAVLRRRFKPALRILEIGSHIGVVSQIACDEVLLPGGTMVCVEPHPTVFPCLRQNLRCRSDQVLILQHAAIGLPTDSSHMADFVLRASMSSGLVSHSAVVHSDFVTRVPVLRLSELVGRIGGSFSLICDAEGAEISMIINEPEAFHRCEQILMELHAPALTGSTVTPDELILRLRDLHFRLAERIGNTCCFDRVE